MFAGEEVSLYKFISGKLFVYNNRSGRKTVSVILYLSSMGAMESVKVCIMFFLTFEKKIYIFEIKVLTAECSVDIIKITFKAKEQLL